MLTIIELMHIPKNCQEEKLGFNGGGGGGGGGGGIKNV